jgi:hypothetical protein
MSGIQECEPFGLMALPAAALTGALFQCRPVLQLLAQVSLTAERINVPTPPDGFNGFHGSFAAPRANKSIDIIRARQAFGRSAEDIRRNKKPRRKGAVCNVSFLQQRVRDARVGRLKCLYAGGQARQLPRDRILVHQALRHAAVQFRHHRLEGRLGRALVAGLERFLNLPDEGTDAALARLVPVRPALGLPDPLFGADRMCHYVKTLLGNKSLI